MLKSYSSSHCINENASIILSSVLNIFKTSVLSAVKRGVCTEMRGIDKGFGLVVLLFCTISPVRHCDKRTISTMRIYSMKDTKNFVRSMTGKCMWEGCVRLLHMI